MRILSGSSDRLAGFAGGATLVLLVGVYPLFDEAAERPLAVFLLPGLVAAAIGGWRVATAIGVLAFGAAAVIGVLGPLNREGLAARLTIIGAGTALGAASASLRGRLSVRVDELDDTEQAHRAFEQSLAPRPIVSPGYRAVVAYASVDRRLDLGGDFVDVVPLSGGRLGAVVGDVCGHGPRAAAVGVALRAAWKTAALTGACDPVRWIDELDRSFFRDGRIETYVTVLTGYFDLPNETAVFCSAGHPPPILLGSAADVIATAPRTPLGIEPLATASPARITWDGTPVLLYTDGLTDTFDDRRERWGETGLRNWLHQRRAIGGDLDALARDVLRASVEARTRVDDAALVIVSGDDR